MGVFRQNQILMGSAHAWMQFLYILYFQVFQMLASKMGPKVH